ncbi:MAG TPA: hypothetical protein VFT59_04315 [Candidatus Saccharimonadales bacterium]|nr:hypothetical protein [Candidatus Saccharimonadales bacterium]
MRRPPAPLPQNDEYGCVICVVANLLYMFYIHDHPNVHWVNEQLNRKVGDKQFSEPSPLLLLNQGLSVYGISEFDNRAYIHHGIAYLKYFYRDLWNEEWDELNTPEAVAIAQARILKLETEVAARNLSRYIESRKPTIEDIARLVRAGCVVDLAAREGSCAMSHAVLIYDVGSDGYFSVYDPAPDTSMTLYEMSADELIDEWDGMWLNAWWREH